MNEHNSVAPSIVIRALESSDDYAACVELQKNTWGREFKEITAPVILQISQKVGGIAAGAFNGDGDLCGFLFGLSGIRDGELVHWSHMLAVRPENAGVGLGTRLKAFQRSELLKLGISVVNWTYDPLEARNAHLNYNRLGAKAVSYLTNLYGTNTGSALHSGLGTDRFMVRWNLTDPTVEDALAGNPPQINPTTREAPVANTIVSGDSIHPANNNLPDCPLVRVEIPSNIDALKAKDMDLAKAWRENTREVFTSYLDRSYLIDAFFSDRAAGRAWYVLKADSGTAK